MASGSASKSGVDHEFSVEHGLPADEGFFGTAAIHAGQSYDQFTGAVIPPISLATTYAQESPGVPYPANLEYSRSGNPNRNMLEANVAALENAKYGVAFASGLAATAGVIHLLEPGDHVISIDDVYGGTQRYFRRIAYKNSIQFSFVDMSDEAAYVAAFTDKTKLVWVETPTNPTLKIVDIARLAAIAHERGAKLLVDNTFATPYFQQPLELGADFSLHSVSKYLNGHSDVIMGLVLLNDEPTVKQLRFLQNGMGGIPSPFDCWLVMRGLKTLHLRMEAHDRNARRIAAILEGHPKVDRVVYPGLPSHPQHELAKRQMKGFGGMITFFIKGGLEEARRFLENLKIFTLAESLGGVESLAEHPAIMTHASVPPEQRALLGISDTLIRLSVGVEDIRDLEKDVLDALEKA